MSYAHDIDNEVPLFEFDLYEPLNPGNHLEVAAREPQSTPSHTEAFTNCFSFLNPSPPASWYREESPSDAMWDTNGSDIKGKGVSQPMLIHMQGIPEGHSLESAEFFLMSPSSESSSAHLYGQVHDLSSPPSLPASPAPDSPVIFERDHAHTVDDEFVEGPTDKGKGKARELPPTLPPLSFIPTELDYEGSNWPSFESSSPGPGPSSYGSIITSGDFEPGSSAPVADRMSPSPEPFVQPVTLQRMPSRRRSLSHLSIQTSHSVSALSLTKVKVKPSGTKSPGNLARKLLFKKRTSPPQSPSTSSDGADTVVDIDLSGCIGVGEGSCLVPWARDVKPRNIPLASPALEPTLGGGEARFPIYYAGRMSDNTMLRTKGRSYSSPLPLPSTALDLIPAAPADIFQPTPKIIPCYFDEFLPRELKLQVFAALVDLHHLEHEKSVQEGKWTFLKATSSKNKWVGRDRGIRELFKLSRVSKSWQTLVLDGQLWARLNLRSFPKLPPTVIARLAQTAGSFVRHIDLTGHSELSSDGLQDIIVYLCTRSAPPGGLDHTNLTTLNLQGCTSLSTHSLHHLLIRSPSLLELRLKGLSVVTNTTCDIIAVYCTKLEVLDLSRCNNMTADGIQSLTTAILGRKSHLYLKELRLAGLRRFSDQMMASLGKAAPHLEVLDLSYARDLHNSALEAFISSVDGDGYGCDTVQLTSREAGRDPADPTKYWRRVTHLRQLSLSSCIMLTDHACSHLAYTVPKLEFLELAGIGAELRDEGLVHLLETTPYIRKLDLEDACDITDDVLNAITPIVVVDRPSARGVTPPQPGHALEHLTISYAAKVTNEALLELIQACERLRVLEADNTRMSGVVMKAFVEAARERELVDAQIAAVDCRSVGEYSVKDLSAQTRPRVGWRGWEAKKLAYLDARDEEGLSVGQDECDELRVALKTFYSWQTVDAVRAAREKRRRHRRGTNASSSSGGDEFAVSATGRARWWSPSGRRSGVASPTLLDINNDREGCTIM
ncbi:RNI-like protein [Amylocystis lapponica]|nr:RNI-like protein [Amylocystis lapponica]